MTDQHHHVLAQALKQRFPRGAVEVECGIFDLEQETTPSGAAQAQGGRRQVGHGSASDQSRGPAVVALDLVLVPVEKPPNPAHEGLPHVSLEALLSDPRNLKTVSREDHARHHSAEDWRIEPDAEALEFARWCGMSWRLEEKAA